MKIENFKKNNQYTLHEHRAKKVGLHFDLRLQKKNDVFSFALPKAKIPEKHTVFLAILTHIQRNNLDVLYFSGKINDGEYGAGTIDIIERLPYEILEWDDNNTKILFNVPNKIPNQYLSGTYYLIKLKKNNQYIFSKK